MFVQFKVIVEKFFQKPTIQLDTDNEGEFLAFHPFLTSHEISHLTTPPHTHQQNGFTERRHRYIIEAGLTLVHQASVPHTYWPYAFATTTYLIHRMPKFNLAMLSFYEKLFGRSLNLSKLRVLRCLCYPWLHLYALQKLSPRSTLCVFVWYYLTQSTYCCLYLSSHKIFSLVVLILLSLSFRWLHPLLRSLLHPPPSSHFLSFLPPIQHSFTHLQKFFRQFYVIVLWSPLPCPL